MKRACLNLVALFACLLHLQAPADAQNLPKDRQRDIGFSQPVFAAPKRTQRRMLANARKLLEQERYSQAVRMLHRILIVENDEVRDEDYFFLNREDREGIRSHDYQSLRTAARQLLGNLPQAARASYELQFGTDAQKMLDRAVEAGNIEAVAEVQRRYFHTRAGYQAMMLLGHYHLDQAAPVMAALCLQEVYTSPTAAEYEPALSLLLARSLQLAGQEEQAKNVLSQLQEKYPHKKLKIAGTLQSQAAEQEDPIDWLTRLTGTRPESQDLPAINWTMFRGNAARTAAGSESRPLMLRPRWRQRIAATAESEQMIEQQSQLYADDSIPAVPALQPLAVGDLIFMRTPGKIVAADLKSGKLVWQEPTSTNDKGFDAPSREDRGDGSEFSMETLRRRVWQDKTFGSLSSDGERLFVLEEFGHHDVGSERPHLGPGGRYRRWTDYDYNVLKARSASEAQGKLLWSLGGPHESDSETKKAFFLGAPLPLQGQLYQLVELAGEIRLLVLDSRTGERLWSQQLAVVQPSTKFTGKRRTGGISPSYSDGVLVCPTGVGGIVAVDLTTRNLRWGHQYPVASDVQKKKPAWNRPSINSFSLPGPEEVWADSCALIADGSVLITPTESNALHCLDLTDGSAKWRVDREQFYYLAGVHAGKAILIGADKVIALDMLAGKAVDLWPLDLPDGSMPSGRGYLAGDRYYLPLRTESGGEVVTIDLNEAKIVARSKSGDGTVPGNLICHRQRVISQNSDYLQSFFQFEPIKREVAKSLRENPHDPNAMLRQGEILVDGGNSPKAVPLFRTASDLYAARAVELAQKGNQAGYADALASSMYARQLLLQGLLTGLEENFVANQGSIPEIETLIAGPRERIDHLRLLAEGYGQTEQLDAALDAYLKLVRIVATENPLLSIDSIHAVRLSQWVRSRLDALQNRFSTAQHEHLDQQVALLQEEALRSENIEEMRSFDFFFGTHLSAVPVKQKLVDLLTSAGDRVESITLLRQLAGISDPVIQRKATAQLALLNKGPDMVGQGAKHIWPEGKVLIKQTGATARGRRLGYQSSMPVRMLSRRDHAVGTVLVDQRQYFRIYGLNSYGQIDWTVPLLDKKENRANLMANHRLSCARAKGQILVAAVGQQVLAIDTLKARQKSSPSSILWRQDTLSPGSDSRSKSLRTPPRKKRRPWEDEAKTQQQFPLRISRIGPITDGGVTFVRNRNLVSVDPITGGVLWIRKGYKREAELFGDREFVMVLPPEEKKIQVLSAMDGRLLGTRTISEVENRWTTVGRHILLWRKVVGDNPFKGRWELALYDPWTEKDVWAQPISGDTKGDLVGLDAVALYDKTEGRFVVLDIFSGEELLDEVLEVDMHIKGIYVVRSEKLYMLVTNRGAQYNRNNKTLQIQPMPQGTGSAFVSGNIYAFDRATGKALWDRPARLEQWGLALQQPVDLPVLVFARRVIDRSQKKNLNSLSFLFMDKQTGRSVVPLEKRTNREYNFEIEGDPGENTVSILFKNSTLTLEFTDTPVPPAGPVQLPAEKPKEKGGMTSLIHSALDVISKAKAAAKQAKAAAKKN